MRVSWLLSVLVGCCVLLYLVCIVECCVALCCVAHVVCASLLVLLVLLLVFVFVLMLVIVVFACYCCFCGFVLSLRAEVDRIILLCGCASQGGCAWHVGVS